MVKIVDSTAKGTLFMIDNVTYAYVYSKGDTMDIRTYDKKRGNQGVSLTAEAIMQLGMQIDEMCSK